MQIPAFFLKAPSHVVVNDFSGSTEARTCAGQLSSYQTRGTSHQTWTNQRSQRDHAKEKHPQNKIWNPYPKVSYLCTLTVYNTSVCGKILISPYSYVPAYGISIWYHYNIHILYISTANRNILAVTSYAESIWDHCNSVWDSDLLTLVTKRIVLTIFCHKQANNLQWISIIGFVLIWGDPNGI